MTIFERIIDFGAAVFNLIMRVVYLFAALWALLMSFATYLPAIFTFLAIGLAGYAIGTYGDLVVENAELGMRCYVFPFYTEIVRPIVDGIIRTFFNNIICWWNGFVWFPYGVMREVIFPMLRDCGFLDTMLALANFLKVFFKTLVVDYIASRQFLQGDMDFSGICAAWQTFFVRWQAVFCCGCNDLCAIATKLPAISPWSDQWRDDQTWCFIGNTFNGFMKFVQDVLKVVSEFVYPTLGALPRPVFRDAFDRWCDASTCFWKSWENALQNFWDAFIPYEFVWKDLFCAFDVMTCIALRSINLLLKLLINYDKVLAHFTNVDSTFWIQVVKEDYKEIINLWGPATYFAPITQTLPDMSVMEITTYQLLNTDQAKPNLEPNPLFGKLTVQNCSCIFMTRIFCDPTNNGTTCAERYNGTLLADYDFCCFFNSMITFGVDHAAWMFEFTLHLQSADNFVVFLNNQPFSKQLKDSFVGMFNCLFAVFLVIDTYGKCIQTVLTEIIMFFACMFELFFRIVVAALSLFYYEANLPGLCNLLTCTPDGALNEAISFLDRIVANTPDSLINCLCFLLNTGFPVPPAGCTMGCVVGGFVPPPTSKRSSTCSAGSGSFRKQLNPLYDYSKKDYVRHWNAQSWWENISFQKTGEAFDSDIRTKLDEKMENFSKGLANRKCQKEPEPSIAERLVTQPPLPPIVCDPPPACFDLCCLPRTVIIFATQATAFGLRAINAAFQTRNGTGSPYWDGTGCASGPCFQSDVTAFIVNAVAPLTCLCNFIKLVIPPLGFADPCCFFTLLGEFLSCTVQVAINVLTSMTSDPNYTYIKDPNGLLSDFDILLAIANATFDCLCNFIRVIFGFVASTLDLTKNFDPCCMYQKLFRALVEVVRLLGQTLISFATLEQASSQCYFYIASATRPTCVPTLTDLPILVQFDRIRAVLLAPPTYITLGQCAAQVDPSLIDRDKEGIATCICTIINAVLAQVYQLTGNDPVECPLDICCFVYNTGTFIDEALRFLSRLVGSLWQNWELRSQLTPDNQLIGPYSIPVELIEFFFCDEYRGNPIGGPLGSGTDTPSGVVNPNGLTTDKCGKVEPVLQALNNLMTGCLCAFGRGIGDLADNFLQWFLAFVSDQTTGNPFPIFVNWPKCLCHGGPDGSGILRPAGELIVIILRQVLILLRNLPNASYWAPAGGSLTNSDYVAHLDDNLADINKTWISRFLTPFAEGMCTFITNLACLLQMIIGSTCQAQAYNVLSSIIRYLFEAIIRAIAILEAFVKQIAQELPGQCIGDPNAYVGTSGTGAGDTGNGVPADVCAPNLQTTAVLVTTTLDADSLGSILVALLTFLFDALIGIGKLGCTTICPTQDYTYQVDEDPPVLPAVTACSCYNKTPYTAKPTTVCSLESCAFFGTPDPVCPGGAEECTFLEVCGGDPEGGCPRLSSDLGFQNIFRTLCNGGCKNMTEPQVSQDPSYNTWDQAPATSQHPWVLGLHPVFLPVVKVPICITDMSVSGEAQAQFGDGLGNPIYQPICIRSDCVARGFCKNDQMVKCSPNDPRGVLDGIIIAALKFIQCILDLLFGGLGSLISPILGILSFLWQLSGGIVRFAVSLFIFLFKIVTRNPFVNFFSLIPDTLTLLFSFFAIFVQPVVGVTKTERLYNATITNPLEEYQKSNIMAMAYKLFGTNLDGCIDDPIPCFCRHLPNISSECTNNYGESLTVDQVTMYMSQHFDGITACDEVMQFYVTQQPTKWTDVCYGVRMQYIDCVAKRVQGEIYANTTTVWPKDFFYSQDGWYKLAVNMKNHFANHISAVTKAEEELMKSIKEGRKNRFAKFYKNLDSRAKIFEQRLYAIHKIPEDSPAVPFLINLDSFWHKYQMGYYHIIGRRAWDNIKQGRYTLLGSMGDSLQEMRSGMYEMYGSFRHLKYMAPHMFQSARIGFNAVGRMFGDLMSGNRDRFGTFKPDYDPSQRTLPAFLQVIYDGSLARHYVPKMQTNIVQTFEKTKSHIWENIKKVEVRFATLSWMQGPKWTPEKLYNYESFNRLFHRLFYTVWPTHMPVNRYERFILDGNCRVADGIVDKATEIVDYCVNKFKPNVDNLANKTSSLIPPRRGSFFARFAGKYHYEEATHPGDPPRIRVTTTPKSGQKPKYKFDRLTYRRSRVAHHNIGRSPQLAQPGMFDLFDWIICVIEDLFNISLAQDIDGIVGDINNWFNNPNIDPADYPDVGARYWLTFPFRCEFPENLNCSIGIGLEAAIGKVTLIFIIGFLILAFLFPAVLSLLGGIGAVTLWIFIVYAVAFHYSPACALMWPTYTIQQGLSIPIPLFPISALATPECMWDEILALTDKYITNDYSFIINGTLVNGPTAPTCPARIDFINCKELGLYDGLQNILYWGQRWFGPTFCDIVIGLAGTVLGRIFPSLELYLQQTLDRFKNASPAEMEQLDWCGKYTSFSIGVVFAIGLPFVLFILFIVPVLIDIIVAFWFIIRASALWDAVTGEGEGSEYFDVEAEDEEGLGLNEVTQGEEAVQGRVFVRLDPNNNNNNNRPLLDRMALGLRNLVPGYEKNKKE